MIVSMQKYPLMWKIFTFSSSFPKSPHHFLLKNVFCSHHWQMDIACRALLNAECHQTWPRQARRRAISLTCHNPWAVAPRCPLWQSLVLWPLLTTFVLFLLFLKKKKKPPGGCNLGAGSVVWTPAWPHYWACFPNGWCWEHWLDFCYSHAGWAFGLISKQLDTPRRNFQNKQ